MYVVVSEGTLEMKESNAEVEEGPGETGRGLGSVIGLILKVAKRCERTLEKRDKELRRPVIRSDR